MADIAIQAEAQNINMVTKFESNLHNLLTVLGKAEVNVLPNGHTMKVYKTSGTLQTTQVAEGEEITPSEYSAELDHTVELTFEKYIKYTGMESISTKGYDVAVANTDEGMLRDIQKGVRKTIYAGIMTGTGTASGSTFQAALAQAWAKVNEAFEDEEATFVFFANPLDVADYLGTANVTLQTAFGMSYLENFLGLGNVIVDSNVTQGTVIGTAAENLDVVAADISGIEGMDLVTDKSGIIGVHNGAAYERGSIETFVACGLEVFPVYLDRVVLSTIAAA